MCSVSIPNSCLKNLPLAFCSFGHDFIRFIRQLWTMTKKKKKPKRMNWMFIWSLSFCTKELVYKMRLVLKNSFDLVSSLKWHLGKSISSFLCRVEVSSIIMVKWFMLWSFKGLSINIYYYTPKTLAFVGSQNGPRQTC